MFVWLGDFPNCFPRTLAKKAQELSRSTKSISLNEQTEQAWIKWRDFYVHGVCGPNRICPLNSSNVMFLKCGPLLQLQASGSSQKEKGMAFIGHVILWEQELFTVGEGQHHIQSPLPPCGQLGRKHCAHEGAFLMDAVHQFEFFYFIVFYCTLSQFFLL